MNTRTLLALLAWPLAAAAAPPEAGLWYDPDRSGNGLDLQRSGNVLFGAFYTYDVRHMPEWLWLQTADTDAPAGTLTRFRKVQGRLEASVAGQFSLTPDPGCQTQLPLPPARARLRMDFTLDGQAYKWCMEPLLPAASVPEAVASGAWYDPADPGWGLFAHHYPGFDGRTQTYRTLYYHDSSGAPRWAFAQDRHLGPSQVQVFYRTTVECTGCGASPPLTLPIGIATIALAGPGAAPDANRISTSLSFEGEAPFVRDTRLVLLSDQ